MTPERVTGAEAEERSRAGAGRGVENADCQAHDRGSHAAGKTPSAFQGLEPESPGQNLAVTVLYVPYSLDSGPSYVYHSKPLSITRPTTRTHQKLHAFL